VLGAGPCGIGAASTFLKQGVDVAVLEARDRVGGRVYTNEDGLDLGAQWIHQNTTIANPILNRAQEYGVAVEEKYPVKAYVATSLDGKTDNVTSADRFSAEAAFDKCMEILGNSAKPGETFEDTLRPILDIYESQLSVTSWRVLQNLLEFWLFIEGGTMTELGSVAFSAPSPLGPDFGIKGGYGNLYKKIAKDDGVMDVVKFNKVVKRVKQEGKSVEVEVEGGEIY